jgi:hypothetical protein
MNDPKRILIVFLGLVLVVLGVLGVKGHFESEGYKTQVRYTTAIQAEDATHFNYAVDSQQGNLLVNGTFDTDTKNLVKFDEMTKYYTFVERKKEHYTPHTSCGGKPVTCHTYYSWDTTKTEEQKAPKVTLYEREYDGNLFNFKNFLQDTNCKGITNKNVDGGWLSKKEGCDGTSYYLDGNDRYVYRTVPQRITATFLANSLNGGLKPVNEDRITLEDKSIKQQLHDIGQYKLIIFWVILVIVFLLFCGAAYLAYAWVWEDGEWSLNR